MSEFRVINTKEEFDQAINQRLERERSTVEKKYEGYLSPEDVEKKYEGYLSPEDAAKKDAAIQAYEKNSQKVKIAMEEGIPYELSGKISGDTEEDMKKDAKSMAGFLKKGNPYPEYHPNQNKDTKKEAMKKMLNSLKGE